MSGLTDTCCQNAASVQDWPRSGQWVLEYWVWSGGQLPRVIFGCMGAWASSALEALRTSLDSCFLLSSTTTCAYCLCAPAWGPMWLLLHVLLLSLPPSLREGKTQHSFIHSTNWVWRCCLHILFLGLFLLHFHRWSECRKSSRRAGAWSYLVFVEEVSLIVAFVKFISLETHWHINAHLEGFWDVLHSTASSKTLVAKCASWSATPTFSCPLTQVCMSQISVFLSGKEGDKEN